MLLPRVLTAILGIPAILYIVYLGNLPYFLFALALSALALYEYGLVLWVGGRGVQRVIAMIGGAGLCAAVALSGPPFAGGPGLAELAVSALVLAVMLRETLRREHSFDRAAVTLLGAFFIGWPLGHLPLIRAAAHGEAWTYWLFAAVWASDTCAYFAGRVFGRHRIAQILSPKKTWEGAVGGTLGAFAVTFLARKFFLGFLSPAAAAVLALLVAAMGQMSDAAQSLVKRAAGAKDSGAMLPGHGGVFDRMDSFLLLAPIVYWLQTLLGG